jgi:metal-sulfur cluster biosynthetic enzyme
MNPEMTRRIDTVLDAVKDPESGLSVAQIGLVKRLRYSAEARTLLVFTRPLGQTHGCCTLIALTLLEDVQQRLLEALGREFPDLTIRLAGRGFE